MVDLDAIERRVRATICPTWSSSKPKTPILQGRISAEDFEALMRAARGLEASTVSGGGDDPAASLYGGAGGGDDTGAGGGGGYPCAYPDCECDNGTGPCWHMRDTGHTTFPTD